MNKVVATHLVCLLLAWVGVSLAQEVGAPLTVQSIRIKLVSTTPEPLVPVDFSTIADALKRRSVNLAVAQRFEPAQLQIAGDVIRDVYGASGRKVRVDHSVTGSGTRGAEITFEVIEICSCK